MDNLHQFKGTIFEKIVKTGPSKKAGEPDWQMCIMKIESDVKVKGKTVTSVCEYIFDWGVSFEEFSERDYVTADFYFKNREINTKNGVWKKEEKRIIWMKHGDITTPPPPKTYGNKVQVSSMSNTKELTNPKPAPKADVFDTPRPYQEVEDDGEYDKLPF